MKGQYQAFVPLLYVELAVFVELDMRMDKPGGEPYKK